jgi:Dolichyl-phosphate-mannose-protein mannosyltransferase
MFACTKAPAPALGELLQTLGLLTLLGVCYITLVPGTINGDGLGYLKQVPGVGLAPGHLAYLPLLRTLAGPWSGAPLLHLALPFRLLSAGAALSTIALLYAAGRRLYGHSEALFAAALLGVSQAFFWSAIQVEVYAPATLLVTATLWALARHATPASSRSPRALNAGLAGALAGAALSFHLTLALLGPALLTLIARQAPPRRRIVHVGIAALAMSVVGGGLVGAALIKVGRTEPVEAWRWLMSSDHGVPYPHSWRTPLVVLWGAARSLVHAPYPYEAPIWRVALQTALGVGAWFGLLTLRGRIVATASSPADRTSLLIWSVPLIAFAAAFYPSDTERWIFIMPAVALFLAPCAGRAGWGLLAGVLLINVLAGQLPAALERSPGLRAAAAERSIPPRALVVSPGHGWDELVGLGTTKQVRRFPLIYHVGAERSLDRAVLRMHAEIKRAARRGDAVFVARLKDPDDPRGFKELRWFGLTAAGFAELFRPYRPRPAHVDGLWRLSPQLAR